jgi:hypothetical protein
LIQMAVGSAALRAREQSALGAFAHRSTEGVFRWQAKLPAVALERLGPEFPSP